MMNNVGEVQFIWSFKIYNCTKLFSNESNAAHLTPTRDLSLLNH